VTQDEIHKLLGGYAADELTEEERGALFQAALEDQELFNALQNEDALKELLADPVTRGQLRAALSAKPRAFHWRRWMVGVAVPAAIALAAVVMMNRAHAPKLVAMKEAAKETVPEKVAALPPPAPAPKKQAASKARPVTPAPPAAPPPSETAARLEPRVLATPAIATLRDGGRVSVVPDAVRQQLAAAAVNDAPLYQGPLLRYSLLRGGRDDRGVRVEVTAALAGYVALYDVDPAGNSKRVYPAEEEAARVLPNIPLQIPEQPIRVASGSRLRLVLAPAPLPPVNGLLAGAQAALGKVNPPQPQTPLVVDIPVAP